MQCTLYLVHLSVTDAILPLFFVLTTHYHKMFIKKKYIMLYTCTYIFYRYHIFKTVPFAVVVDIGNI